MPTKAANARCDGPKLTSDTGAHPSLGFAMFSTLPRSFSSATSAVKRGIRCAANRDFLQIHTSSRAAQGHHPRAGRLRRGASTTRTRASCPTTGSNGRCDAWMAKAQSERRTVRRSRQRRPLRSPGHRGTRSRALLLDCLSVWRSSGRGRAHRRGHRGTVAGRGGVGCLYAPDLVV